MTTTADGATRGAHAAARAPTTVQVSVAAAAQSRGYWATAKPLRRRRRARWAAWDTDGVSTRAGPRRAASNTTGNGSRAGGSRSNVRPIENDPAARSSATGAAAVVPGVAKGG